MIVKYNHYSLAQEIPAKSCLKKRKLIKYFNRETSAAIVTARELFNELDLDINYKSLPMFFSKGEVEFEDMGLEVIVNACTKNGGFSQEDFVKTGLSGISPLTQFKVLYNMPLCFVSIENELRGDNCVIYASCNGLISHILTSKTEEAIIGATKVHPNGSVACSMALVKKDDVVDIDLSNNTILQKEPITLLKFLYENLHKKPEKSSATQPSIKSFKKTHPHKVVIVSAGAVSPIGADVDSIMDNLEKGKKGISAIEAFNAEGFPIMTGAEAKIIDPVTTNLKTINTETYIDRKSVFFEQALEEMLKNVDISSLNKDRIAMHVGTGFDYFNLVDYVTSEEAKSGKWQKFCSHANRTVENLTDKYNLNGGSSSNVSACVASTQAIGLSFKLIKDGHKDFIVSGGYDSMLCHLHYMGFYKLGALSDYTENIEEACRPFDKNRRGLVIGEGAIALGLTSEEIAKEQGFTILAEIVGYSSTMDSYMATDPDPEGRFLAKAALEAIAEAGISPADIDCVHLHGTGTFKNAISESKAMQLIFGENATNTPVFSMKGQIGHLIGACGAMETLGVIDSLQNQRVLPTINFETPDPNAPLNVVTQKPLEMPIKYVLKLNSAFGGQNTALVYKKADNQTESIDE